jgi:hypothetical protein
MNLKSKFRGRSLRIVLIVLPLLLTIMALTVTSTTFAQSGTGGLGVGRGNGLEIGINVAALNALRADINAGMYNRPCTAQEHNRTQWHTLVNPVARCHHDHHHGDDPNYVNDIFGAPGAWFGSPGQSISYPWQTFPAATAYEANTQYVQQGRMENDLKHEGYIWLVRRDQTCGNGANCTTDFRLQTHAIMGAHDMPVRYHSVSFEGRVCANPNNPSTCGIVRVGGWIDMGRLFTTAPNNIDCGHGVNEIFIPLPADNLYFPIDRPDSRDEIRCHPNIINLPARPSARPLAEWWGHGPGDRLRYQLRAFDPIGNVDAANPARWQFFCQPADPNCRYDASIFSVFIGYILKVYGGFDTNDNFVDLDPDDNDIAMFRAYADRWGTINPGCTAAALDCVPVEYNNVVLNAPQFREGFYEHSVCLDCPRIDHDISPSGQKWVTWFYRYMEGATTPSPEPTTPSPEPTTPSPEPTTPSPEPTGPAVVIEVNPTVANMGEPVEVTLRLVNVTDVYGLQSDCSVNPAVLLGSDISEGDGFTSTNSFYVNSGYVIAEGTWLVAASRLKPNGPISGNAIAYSLNYVVQNPGSTDVNCAVLAVDGNGNAIPLEVINGTYDGSSPTPEPTEETPVPTEETPPVPTEETPPPPTETPEVTPAGSITGLVAYQNAPDNAGIQVSLLVNNAPSNQLVTGADGAFSFADVAAGSYVIQVKGPQHLLVTVPVTVDASGQAVDLGTIELVAGDTDDDGDVDITDATFIGSNFDNPVPPAPSSADLNHDLSVNISDLVLVGSNFGQTSQIPTQ